MAISWLWIILGGAVIALALLGVLILAAVRASRSRPRESEKTPTQQTQNPYRKFYDRDHH